MYSNLALNNFKALKASVEKAGRHSRLQSRLPSRYGTPSVADDTAPSWDMEFLDPLFYLGENASFPFDPFSDSQNMSSEQYLTTFG